MLVDWLTKLEKKWSHQSSLLLPKTCMEVHLTNLYNPDITSISTTKTKTMVIVSFKEAIKLFSADPEEIALVESTSYGLNIAASGIPLEERDGGICRISLSSIATAPPEILSGGA